MKAVGYRRALPLSDPDALIDLDVPEPAPGDRDLLVDVRAVSVNPVDTKVRASSPPESGGVRILGWDAAGVVLSAGAHAELFRPGDRVWYAGSMARAGTDAQRHVVDERLVGRMPKSLDFAHAAALPLTTITAWELLFDRLEVLSNPSHVGNQLLIIGATGGVGSMLVQLARKLTGLTVIGTASSAEGKSEVLQRGAHYCVDYRDLLAGVRELGLAGVAYVASLTHTDGHLQALSEVLLPAGRLGLIDDPVGLETMILKPKCISLHWEFMFSRSLFQTPDMGEQGQILNRVATLLEEGKLLASPYESYGPLNAENLRRAHAAIESGHTHGKIVLEAS